MNRRDATTALVALGTAGPFVARAQSKPSAQSKVLGVLTLVASQDAKRLWLDGFHAKLKALGWFEGQNLVIESAFADYKADRLAELAEELVRKRVEWRAQAVAVAGSLAIFAARERLAAFALRNRPPSACAGTTLVDAGGLLSYNAAGGFNVTSRRLRLSICRSRNRCFAPTV